MAKTLYPTNGSGTYHRGNNDANLAGTAVGWSAYALSEARGTSQATASVPTVTGPTNGLEVSPGGGSNPSADWTSEPLSADFTISGTITLNLWAYETSMNDNVAINAVIDKVDGATGAITRIAITARTTEVALTTAAVNNFTVTPTSTACKRGDRIRLRVFCDDAGTMAAPGPGVFSFNGPTAAAAGDSYITFTENLTFELSGDAGAVYETQDTSNPFAFGNVTNQQQMAQRFFAQYTGISDVRIKLMKTGNPTDDAIIELWTSVANAPGALVATIATVPASSISGGLTYFYFSGLNITGLTKGNAYYVLARRSGALDSNNYFSWTYGSGGASDPTPQTWNGSVWSTLGGAQPASLRVQGFAVSTYYLNDSLASGLAPVSSDAGAYGGAAVFGYDASNQAYGQPFVAMASALTQIEINMTKTGSPTDSWDITIYRDSGNGASPTLGSIGQTIGQVARDSMANLTSGSLSGGRLTLPCNLSLIPGMCYWIFVSRVGTYNNANYANVGIKGTLALTGGFSMQKQTSTAWVDQPNNQLAVKLTFASAGAKEAKTTRGSGSVVSTTQGVTGWAAPVQITNAASGGYPLEWYTPPLNAFTLTGKASVNARGNYVTNGCGMKLEIAVVNGDGSGAVVWAAANNSPTTSPNGSGGGLNSVDTNYKIYPAGDDIAVTAGQRLRFRVFMDDAATGPMVSGGQLNVSYAGPTAGAAGDFYVQLPLLVTEQILSTPISGGVDTGTTSESASVTKIVANGSDSGTESEQTALTAQMSAVEATGPETEVATIAVPVASSDSGTVFEAQSLVQIVPVSGGTDTGTIAESTILAYTAASSDANLVTTEAIALIAVLVSPDPTGSETETATAKAVLSSSDTNGATTESASAGVPLSSADAGSISESATVRAFVSDSDPTGPENETATLAVQAASADSSGSFAETSALALTTGDTAGATESAAVTFGAVTDSGSVNETATAKAVISSSDSGTGSDTATTATISQKSDSDVATDSETATANVLISATDSGGESESALINKVVPDSGTVAESASLASQISSADIGTSVEGQAVVVSVSSDAGMGTETATVRVFVSSADTNGTLTESGSTASVNAKTDADSTPSAAEGASASAGAAASDNGSSAESASVRIFVTVSDLATAAEVFALVGKIFSTDSGLINETSLSVVQLTGADSGTASELVQIGKSVSDNGTALDVENLLAIYISGDIGNASETEDRWPPLRLFTGLPPGVILSPAMGDISSSAVGWASKPSVAQGNILRPSRGRILK